MPNVILTREGEDALERVLGVRAAILRPALRQKMLRNISLLMMETGATEAGKALVIEAGRLSLTKAFEPVFTMMEDGDRYRKDAQAAWVDWDGYYARPRQVLRWPPVPFRPAKPPEEMRLLAFYGSPRKGGNTDILMEEALRGAKDAGVRSVEGFHLQTMNMKFCIGCRKCKEPGFTGYCAIKDDMTEVYPKIVAADLIVIGFPIYTGRECGQLAVLLDRWDCFEGFKLGDKHRLKPGRRAMVIGTWGYPRVERVITTLSLHQVETVEAISASGFAGKLHGWDDDHKANIRRYPEELKKAYQAGRSLVTGS